MTYLKYFIFFSVYLRETIDESILILIFATVTSGATQHRIGFVSLLLTLELITAIA